MKISNLYKFSFILIAFILTSCSSVYIPNNSTPKDFKGGNEAFGSLYVGPAGVNVNVAYSPVNHVYVHGAISNVRFLEEIFPQINLSHTSESHQFGLGFYTNIKSIYLETEFGVNNGSFDYSGMFSNSISVNYNGFYSNVYNLTSISTPVSGRINFGFGVKSGFNTFHFYNYQSIKELYKEKEFRNTFQLEVFMNFKYKFNEHVSLFNYYGLYAPQLQTSSQLFQIRLGLVINLRKPEKNEI